LYEKQERKLDCKLILAIEFATHIKKYIKSAKLQIFTTSITNIDKTLTKKKKINSCTKLLKHYWKHFTLFDDKEINKLSSLRKDKVDYRIELIFIDEKKSIVS